MKYNKIDIFIISDLEHSIPRIPALIEHFDFKKYNVTVIGANEKILLNKKLFPEKFINKITFINFKRKFDLFTTIKKNTTFNKVEKNFKFYNFFKKLTLKILFDFLFPDQYFFTINSYLKMYKLNSSKKKKCILISSSPYTTVHFAANKIKKTNPKNIIWIADYRDLWTLNHFYNKSRIRKIIDKYYEKKIMKNADLITTVSSHLANKQSSFLNKKVEVIYNGFSEYNNQNSKIKSINFDPEKTYVMYSGSHYFNFRDYDDLFSSISKFDKRIVFHFFGKFTNEIETLKLKYNISDQVIQKGKLPINQVQSMQEKYDYLLFIDSKLDIEGTFSLKIYDYFKSCRPIICIGKNKLSNIKKMIKNSNRGLNFYNGEEFKMHIDQNPQFFTRPKSFKLSSIEKFSYKFQSIILQEHIDKISKDVI